MAEYGFPDNPGLTTQWRLYAWWLHTMWGYKVLQVRHTPRIGLFGRLTMDETYLLGPEKETKH